MMLIACPHCGPRAHVEFDYGRTLDAILPLDASPEQAAAVLSARDNPRGVSQELWRHTHGCRAWLVLTRHTVSHEISAVVPWVAATAAPRESGA